jgi:hypothetical protein
MTDGRRKRSRCWRWSFRLLGWVDFSRSQRRFAHSMAGHLDKQNTLLEREDYLNGDVQALLCAGKEWIEMRMMVMQRRATQMAI